MKQFLPALLLLLFINTQASAQNSPAAKIKGVEDEEWEKAFVKVAMEGEFPGGDSAWNKFVARKLVYPKAAIDKKIEGTVTVKFIIDTDGSVSNAEVLSGPEELRQSAINVILKSPKWQPAIQCGRQVKAYKKRDIVFKLDKV